MTVATESADVRTKLENVRANLIVYRHYVCALVNPYFKLCIMVFNCPDFEYLLISRDCTLRYDEYRKLTTILLKIRPF